MKPPQQTIRFSFLKLMGRSPAHYRYAIDNEGEDTAAYRLGRLAHRLILGIGRELVVYEDRRQGKLWEAFKLEHDGAEIVSRKEYENCLGMVKSFRAHHMAPRLVDGLRETTLRWTRVGRQCSGTPDAILTDRGITDLKTCDEASPYRFGNIALRYGYHAQLAWYLDGAAAAGMKGLNEAWIVAIEKKAPYVVTCFKLTERALEAGRRLATTWWEQLLVCEESNVWPGYAQSVVDLDAPDDMDELTYAEETVEETA